MWREHERRWPGEERSRAGHQRPGDPPGSWRGDGDRYLSPERNAQADRLISDLRQPGPSITAQLQQIEQENPHGGKLVGLDHCFKGGDRLKEKIADSMEKEAESTVADAVAAICDAVRYTFCFDADHYANGYRDIRELLELAGYKLIYCKNHWIGDPHYKGVNTRWATPHGDSFELQFHIAESAHAKEQMTHSAYERLRAPGSSRRERRELVAFERVVSAAVPEPTGIAMIG